jgi:hypothetical protein
LGAKRRSTYETANPISLGPTGGAQVTMAPDAGYDASSKTPVNMAVGYLRAKDAARGEAGKGRHEMCVVMMQHPLQTVKMAQKEVVDASDQGMRGMVSRSEFQLALPM